VVQNLVKTRAEISMSIAVAAASEDLETKNDAISQTGANTKIRTNIKLLRAL
jgi:hypothetical protein